MDKHNRIVDDLAQKYNDDENVLAFLVTGSVARGEASAASDLDIRLIGNKTITVEDQLINGVLVETKYKTAEDYITKMIRQFG